MMKLNEFIEKLKMAESCKTLYIKGCFGAPMNDKNKKRYAARPENITRIKNINAATPDTFGFDCVCLIKGILWGWDGSVDLVYGGAKYKSNGVPDVGADGIVKYLKNVSTDFSTIQVGECVWTTGHVGVYVGNGRCIECTPKWTNDVQYSNLGNNGFTTGHCRFWKKHGFLPWVDYNSSSEQQNPAGGQNSQTQEEYYIVKSGDAFDRIAKKYGMTREQLKALNPQITNINKIYPKQLIRVK